MLILSLKITLVWFLLWSLALIIFYSFTDKYISTKIGDRDKYDFVKKTPKRVLVIHKIIVAMWGMTIFTPFNVYLINDLIEIIGKL